MPTDNDSDDLLSLTDAAALMGVSKVKVSRILKAGLLTEAGRDPLDRRSKLVRRSEVLALLRRSPKSSAA